MFTIARRWRTGRGTPVTLFPMRWSSARGRRTIQGFFILHEGLIGVLDETGLEEIS